MTSHRDWPTWLGLGVVGAAAAIMSFAALSDLAELCGITATSHLGPVTFRVAWLLPLAVDVLAAVSTRVWLQRRANAEAVAFARRSAWSAIAATVGGNAFHGALTALGDAPGPWAFVLVSAVPAVALGGMVHLAVLVGRGPDQPPAEPRATDPWGQLLDQVVGEAWDRPIGAWMTEVQEAERAHPGRDATDTEIAADLRRHNTRTGGPAGRIAVMRRYGVGAGRADKLREMADESTDVTAVDVA